MSAFVAAGFMHSPANMGFFSLATPDGIGPGWGPALAWSIAPSAIGNVLGAFFLVALPFWLVNTRQAARRPDTDEALSNAWSSDGEREPAVVVGI